MPIATHRPSRSRYTPVTSSSVGGQKSSLGASQNRAEISSPDHSTSIKEADKLELENKDEENGKFEKIRPRLPSGDDITYEESDAEPKSDSDSEINPLIEAENKDEEEGNDKFKKNRSPPPLRSHGAYTAPTRGYDDGPESESESSASIEPSRKAENQDEDNGNGKFEKIRRSHQPTDEFDAGLRYAPEVESEAESNYKSIHEPPSKNEVDHDTDATVDTVAGEDHEAETASQAAAHLDSLDPLNPPAEQGDARRNANIRANIEKLGDRSDIMTIHGILAIWLFLQIMFFGILYPHFSNTFWCDRPTTTTLLNSSFLLFRWEVFTLVDHFVTPADMPFYDIRYYTVDQIPDFRLREVLVQLRAHRFKSLASPVVFWVIFMVFGNWFSNQCLS
ncbi:hypothetical protein OCU04_007996 [Sclerotinia nivalis]|uniref:Uncharacterized protein n=1 Tax=Sclerotinia nivalis TaxID=352851 RepID=A0A9X0DIC5_9HELO|nr:hypothetical protein OCU04_007996 [Sclerotinia nivalis]